MCKYYAGRVNKYETESEYASWFAVQYCCAATEQTTVVGYRQWSGSAYCMNAPADVLVITDIFPLLLCCLNVLILNVDKFHVS